MDKKDVKMSVIIVASLGQFFALWLGVDQSFLRSILGAYTTFIASIIWFSIWIGAIVKD